MGGRRPTLPQAELAAMLKADNFRDNEYLHALQRTEPVYQTLFELVDLCRKQTHFRNFENASRPPQTFAELEQVLLKIYSGNATSVEARQILTGLQTSPSFYQLLLVKLEALTPHVAWEESKTLEGITIKAPEEVLTLVRRVIDQENKRESVGERAWRTLAEVTADAAQVGTQAWKFITHTRVLAVGLPLLLIATLTVITIENNRLRPIFASAPSDTRSPSLEANSFRKKFKMAMSEYALREYQNALSALTKMQPSAVDLHNNLKTQEQETLLRDYYFYTGASHFVLSQSGHNREEHTKLALNWLSRADSLVQARRMPNSDRETFFLGQAYGFSGQYDEAMIELQKIDTNSSFYRYSKKFREKWFNQ